MLIVLMMVLLPLLLVAEAAIAVAAQQDLQPACDRKIYCDSELLKQVQLTRLYNDSKTFVDLRLLDDEDNILKAFSTLLNETNSSPSNVQLVQFVNKYMAEGNELEVWTPSDLNPEPTFLARVRDLELRNFGRDVNAIWSKLGRHVRADVFKNPKRYSLIPIQNGFVVPGGRFNEIYYWDSYWVIKGLLVCGMRDTARGMIENLLELVGLLGHVPNGNRFYYTQRSQPPLLTAMARMYVDATNDTAWLRKHIDMLETELQYWHNRHSISVGRHTLLRYYAGSNGPRPESYREDYLLVHNSKKSEAEQTELYVNIASTAESGWDFSSRWLRKPTDGNLSTLITRDIVPVDLNAIFAGALMSIGEMRAQLGDTSAARKWKALAASWRYAIENVLWCETDGIWFDYDLKRKLLRRQFYLSNVTPLWTLAVKPTLIRTKAVRVLSYLKDSGALNYPGGVPPSLVQSGQQWDFPNAWPPLQSILIAALENSGFEESRQLAFSLATKWIRSNQRAYNSTGHMYEKYDVTVVGGAGGLGEYRVQDGFGWTNGVVLEMLNMYGDRLTLRDNPAPKRTPT